MKKLLIVYHSQTGNTLAMAEAVLRGARQVDDVDTVMKRAFEATLEDLLSCDGLVIGTPENFGYMSGAVKDFLDRTYYPAQGKVEGLPYAIFVSAGNDGTGAVGAIERIARGYPLKPVCEPVIARNGVSEEILARCEELGMSLATGISMGIF